MMYAEFLVTPKLLRFCCVLCYVFEFEIELMRCLRLNCVLVRIQCLYTLYTHSYSRNHCVERVLLVMERQWSQLASVFAWNVQGIQAMIARDYTPVTVYTPYVDANLWPEQYQHSGRLHLVHEQDVNQRFTLEFLGWFLSCIKWNGIFRLFI